MNFQEIVAESKGRQYAFLLNGVQANILLLVLEMAEMNDIAPSFGGDFSEGMTEVLTEIKDRVHGTIGNNRFITLEEVKKLADQLNDSGGIIDGEKAVQDLVERIWNSRA